MFCTNCGANIPDRSDDCPNCGAKMDGEKYISDNKIENIRLVGYLKREERMALCTLYVDRWHQEYSFINCG